jgi:hypothetical protein
MMSSGIRIHAILERPLTYFVYPGFRSIRTSTVVLLGSFIPAFGIAVLTLLPMKFTTCIFYGLDGLNWTQSNGVPEFTQSGYPAFASLKKLIRKHLVSSIQAMSFALSISFWRLRLDALHSFSALRLLAQRSMLTKIGVPITRVCKDALSFLFLT